MFYFVLQACYQMPFCGIQACFAGAFAGCASGLVALWARIRNQQQSGASGAQTARTSQSSRGSPQRVGRFAISRVRLDNEGNIALPVLPTSSTSRVRGEPRTVSDDDNGQPDSVPVPASFSVSSASIGSPSAPPISPAKSRSNLNVEVIGEHVNVDSSDEEFHSALSQLGSNDTFFSAEVHNF